jgi:hypothetical protein
LNVPRFFTAGHILSSGVCLHSSFRLSSVFMMGALTLITLCAALLTVTGVFMCSSHTECLAERSPSEARSLQTAWVLCCLLPFALIRILALISLIGLVTFAMTASNSVMQPCLESYRVAFILICGTVSAVLVYFAVASLWCCEVGEHVSALFLDLD